MFGKAKSSSHEKDEHLPSAPQLQDLTPASLAESDSTEISCIGPGMTVVGKISSEGTLNVFGRVPNLCRFRGLRSQHVEAPSYKPSAPENLFDFIGYSVRAHCPSALVYEGSHRVAFG